MKYSLRPPSDKKTVKPIQVEKYTLRNQYDIAIAEIPSSYFTPEMITSMTTKETKIFNNEPFECLVFVKDYKLGLGIGFVLLWKGSYMYLSPYGSI